MLVKNLKRNESETLGKGTKQIQPAGTTTTQ